MSIFKPSTPQAAFAWIALLFGLASAALTPPLQAPDEPAHWMRAYQLSQGHWLSPEYGGEIPRSMVRLATDFERLQPPGKRKTSRRFILDEFHQPLMGQDVQFVPFPNTSLYSVLPYALHALLMLLARRLGFPAIALLYAGRAASVFAFALLGWMAIWVTPICKWPMCMVLVCPMSLFLAGSVSADPITTGLCFVAIALVLRCVIVVDLIDWRMSVALLAVMVGVSLCKSAYAPLSLMVLAIDRRKWGGRWRGCGVSLAIIAVCVATCAFWSAATKPMQVHEAGDSPAAQLQWIEHHPVAYAGNLGRSLVTQSSSMVYSGVGILGWLDAPMPKGFLDTYPVILAILILIGDEKHRLPAMPRAIAGGVAALCIVLIVTANYLVWNKIGQSPIIGLQGRYFLPLGPLMMMTIRRRGLIEVSPWLMMVGLTGAGILMLCVIEHRYY